jgi:hypothetical protein
MVLVILANPEAVPDSNPVPPGASRNLIGGLSVTFACFRSPAAKAFIDNQ